VKTMDFFIMEKDINVKRFNIEYLEKENNVLRKCRTCREYKALTTQNFIKRSTKNGWRGECKACYNKTIRLKQELNNTEKERGLKYRASFKQKRPFKVMINTAKGNARRTDKEFCITEDFIKELYEKQNGKCFYTGRKMNLDLSYPDSMSIDRVDSNFGYIESNIVLCQYKINVMKNNLSVKDLIGICKDIIKLHSK